MKIAFKDSKILMISGRTLTPVPGQGPEPGLHYVYTSSEGHGSISASPMSGKKDTLITLSNTPDQNYIFSKYTLNNVDLAGSSFLMPDEDAYVRGYFEQNIFNISVSQVAGGTITAPESAAKGSTVNLRYTVQSGYTFKYFTVNGTQIQGSSFIMPASNVVVSASYEVLDYVQIGTQTWKKYNLAVNDGQGGIVTKTLNYGQGNVTEYYYTLAAAQRVANSISGWHLPSYSEWYKLVNYIGGHPNGGKLASTFGWSGTQGSDTYGFRALPAGWINGSTLNNAYEKAEFFAPDGNDPFGVYVMSIFSNRSTISYSGNGMLRTVRLIKDS